MAKNQTNRNKECMKNTIDSFFPTVPETTTERYFFPTSLLAIFGMQEMEDSILNFLLHE